MVQCGDKEFTVIGPLGFREEVLDIYQPLVCLRIAYYVNALLCGSTEYSGESIAPPLERLFAKYHVAVDPDPHRR